MIGERTAACLGLAVACACAAPAAAHRLAPASLEVRERGRGELEVRFKIPALQPRGTALRPQLPASCAWIGAPTVERAEASATWRRRAACDPGGLVGAELGIAGLAEAKATALARIALADGRRIRAVLSERRPRLRVPPRERPLDVARDYAGLGLHHIAAGPDHLLFVLGLVLLVRGGRALLATVSAFTLGHSATLSLAALGNVSVPPRLAEVAIAATLFALAVELARSPGARASLLGRRPALAAGLFGLVHGLGFAGALGRAGLPGTDVPLALASFNFGVELGQLAFIGLVLGLRAPLRATVHGAPEWLARAPAYGIGSLAAYWVLERSLTG